MERAVVWRSRLGVYRAICCDLPCSVQVFRGLGHVHSGASQGTEATTTAQVKRGAVLVQSGTAWEHYRCPAE